MTPIWERGSEGGAKRKARFEIGAGKCNSGERLLSRTLQAGGLFRGYTQGYFGMRWDIGVYNG